MMVTFVPPDSGPRLGDRPVTEGVYKNREYERLRETVRALKELREKDKPKGRRKKKRRVSQKEGQQLWGTSRNLHVLSKIPLQITVIHIARPMAVECSGGGEKRG